MPQDNTLGAPTEGLGQKVTFAFNTPGGLPQLDAGGATGVKAGVYGGGVKGGQTRATGVKMGPNPTMELIMAVADPILKKNMKQQQQEAYINGMQRAMNGEAVADIAESQPWYASIFGESDVVEGARAYTAQATAQTTIAAMEDQMPELRKMPPKEAQAYYNKAVQGAMTGDPATDMSLMRSITSALPPLMRRQSKEYYGYLQETATAAEAQAFQAGATRLQAGAKGLSEGYTTPEEFAGITDAFVQSVVLAPGRDEKNYKQSMTKNLVGWAQDGNFHALNALRDRDFFDVLDVDQRTQVEKAVEAGESKLRSKYSFDWNDDLSKIKAQAEMPPPYMTSEMIGNQVDSINLKYNAETGSKLGLISPSERAAMVTGSATAIAREKNRQADEAARLAAVARTKEDKDAAAASKKEVIRSAAMSGGLGALVANKAYTEADLNEVAEPLYRAMTPADKVKFLVNNVDYPIEPIKRARMKQVQGAMSSESVDDFMPAFEEYKQLREANAFAADKYYGELYARMEGFYQDVRNGVAPAGAFRDRFIGPAPRSKLSAEEMKAAVATVNSDYNSFLPEWMGGQTLKPGTARRVANELSGVIEQFMGANPDPKAATARALRVAKGRGLEIVGGYTWVNNVDKKQVSLTDYLTTHVGPANEAPVANDRINEMFESAVDELLFGEAGTAGIGADGTTDVAIIRLPGGGAPAFHVQAVVDGVPKNGLLSADDVYTLARKRHERNEKSKLTLGTLPQEPKGQPSLYASKAEWARWREYQAKTAKK